MTARCSKASRSILVDNHLIIFISSSLISSSSNTTNSSSSVLTFICFFLLQFLRQARKRWRKYKEKVMKNQIANNLTQGKEKFLEIMILMEVILLMKVYRFIIFIFSSSSNTTHFSLLALTSICFLFYFNFFYRQEKSGENKKRK